MAKGAKSTKSATSTSHSNSEKMARNSPEFKARSLQMSQEGKTKDIYPEQSKAQAEGRYTEVIHPVTGRNKKPRAKGSGD